LGWLGLENDRCRGITRKCLPEPLVGERAKILPDGSREIVISDNVERSRLQNWALAWYASRVAPKKYGARKPETESEFEQVTRVIVDF